MRPVNTLRLANEDVFFGPGPRLLLMKIEEKNSLNKASMETGISYPKALRMLRKMEKELGFAITESYKGGAEYGGTRLTCKGQKFLQAYIEMEQELYVYAQQLISEKFTCFDN